MSNGVADLEGTSQTSPPTGKVAATSLRLGRSRFIGLRP
jgi:hypothetical protein